MYAMPEGSHQITPRREYMPECVNGIYLPRVQPRMCAGGDGIVANNLPFLSEDMSGQADWMVVLRRQSN